MNTQLKERIKMSNNAFDILEKNGFISNGRNFKGLLFFEKDGVMTQGFKDSIEAKKILLNG